MISGKTLAVIALLAGTAYSVQQFVASCPPCTSPSDPTETVSRCFQVDHGPALLPLYETPLQVVPKQPAKKVRPKLPFGLSTRDKARTRKARPEKTEPLEVEAAFEPVPATSGPSTSIEVYDPGY